VSFNRDDETVCYTGINAILEQAGTLKEKGEGSHNSASEKNLDIGSVAEKEGLSCTKKGRMKRKANNKNNVEGSE